MAVIGFIGIGNMGYPMLLGAIKEFGREHVLYTSISLEQLEYAKKETGIDYITDNKTLIEKSDYIVLAIKPQQFFTVYEDLKEKLKEHQIILSPAAGVTIESIKKGIGRDVKVIRFMPNTPAMVKEGMTCVCYSDDIYTSIEKEFVKRFFLSFGKYVELPQKLMNAGICANGSSPAFVFLFIEALADSVVKYGIPREIAYQLVAQTVLGSAKLVLESGEHPAKLKDNVCSPAGTTIAGISALEEYGFRNAIIKAADAVYARAIELS